MKSKINSLQTASSLAYETIKEMIFKNHLVPSQKITYDQLEEKLKMSKTPILNALNRLEQEEFVMSIPNRGFFIKGIELEEISEFFRIREALEMMSVEEGILNLDTKMLKEIEKAMIAHRKSDFSMPNRNRLALDAKFHLKIAEMGKNRNLVRLLKHVFEHTYLRHQSQGVSSKRLITAANEHQDIFNAIKDGKLAKAKAKMRHHIKAGKIANIKGMQMWSKMISF